MNLPAPDQQPKKIITENPDLPAVICVGSALDANSMLDVLVQYRARDHFLNEKGLYLPRKLDLTQEDATDILLDTLDFASERKGITLPQAVLGYIGKLFRETIVATIDYVNKLTEPAQVVIKNWSHSQFMHKQPVSIELLRVFERQLNTLVLGNYDQVVLNYSENQFIEDLGVTSEIIAASSLFSPFIGVGSKNTSIERLVFEGQKSANYLDWRSIKIGPEARYGEVYKYLSRNYEVVFDSMKEARRYLRF